MSRPAPGVWRALRPVVAANRTALIRLALWSLAQALPVLLSGLFIARAIDAGFLAGREAVGLAFLGAYGVAMLLGAAASRASIRAVADLVEPLRDHLVRMVVHGHLTRAVSGLTAPDASAVARITRQAEMVRQAGAGLLMSVNGIAFSAVAAVIGLAALAPVVTLVALPAIGVMCLVMVPASRELRRRVDRVLIADERLSEDSSVVLGGIRDVVACRAVSRANRDLGERVDEAAEAALSVARVGAVRIGLIAIGARLPLGALVVLAPYLVATDALTPGQALGAAIYLVTGLDPAIRSLVEVLGNVGLQTAVTLRRLVRQSAVPVETSPPGTLPVRGWDIQLRDVTFRYGPHSAPVLQAVDLDLPANAHLAVVGPSGTGKSTLARLLVGVDGVQQGEIRLGGVPLADLDDTALRRTVALVPQESYVFAGALRENLAYLRPEVPDDELWLACERLGLAELVIRCGGLDSSIDHPDLLSQGERQLIALVRTYVSAAQVVILDESTCHLDPVAEARVEEAFVERPGSLVVIAHRISSALRARTVAFVDRGVVRVGTHCHLVAQEPRYAELVGHWHPAQERNLLQRRP